MGEIVGRGAREPISRTVRAGAAALLAGLAVPWLSYELYRLLARPPAIGPIAVWPGGIDLGLFHRMVVAWFDGQPGYGGSEAVDHTYPPATILLFAPIYGWQPIAATTAVYVLTALAALAWLVWSLPRESGASQRGERLLLALVPLGTYPAGAVIGNGQATLHVLAALVGGLLLLRDRAPAWSRDLAATALLVLALAKPTVSGPFLLLVLVMPGGIRVAALVGAAYAGLTVAAASWQQAGVVELLGQFLERGRALATRAGESNLHSLLTGAGLGTWILAASSAMLALFSATLVRLRRADPWLLIGLAAFVARFWTYHRWYDDLLILLPLVALARIASTSGGGSREGRWALALAMTTTGLLLAPGGRYLLPAPWNDVYGYVQVGVWILDSVFLVAIAAAAQGSRGQSLAGRSPQVDSRARR